jgi:hypothetical protein
MDGDFGDPQIHCRSYVNTYVHEYCRHVYLFGKITGISIGCSKGSVKRRKLKTITLDDLQVASSSDILIQMSDPLIKESQDMGMTCDHDIQVGDNVEPAVDRAMDSGDQ